MTGRGAFLAGVLALTQVAAGSGANNEPVPLVPLSGAKQEHCERSGLLRPVCPRVVPKVGAPYLSNLSVEPTHARVLDVFNLERGGEYPQNPERNRPPRMARAGRVGPLYLMPPFPHGGALGNHLVFSWRQRERPYALSLHAWEPLTESVATLGRWWRGCRRYSRRSGSYDCRPCAA